MGKIIRRKKSLEAVIAAQLEQAASILEDNGYRKQLTSEGLAILYKLQKIAEKDGQAISREELKADLLAPQYEFKYWRYEK